MHPAPEDISARIRISVWLILCAGLSVMGILQLQQGLNFRADMLALLPQTQQQPRVTDAIEKAGARLQQQLLVVVTFTQNQAPKLASLQKLATTLQAHLDDSGLFSAASPTALPQAEVWRAARHRLLTPHQAQLIAANPGNLLNDTLNGLYGLGSAAYPIDLVNDPLQLHSAYLRSFAPPHFEPLLGNIYLGGIDPDVYLLAAMQIIHSAFDTELSTQLLQLLEQLTATSQAVGGQLQVSGLSVFAAHGAADARLEISTFGTVSLVGVLILLISTFASLRPLLGTVTCIAVGILSAFVITHWLFGEIHLLTLVFGASLIGISVDYALHYLCDGFSSPVWTPGQGLRSVVPGISLAMATSVLAFLSFTLTPFPGLQQMAVFSATGLVSAWLTVLMLLPSIGWRPRADTARRALKIAAFWSNQWPLLNRPGRYLVGAVLLLVIAWGLWQLQPNDNVQVLQSAPQTLLESDVRARARAPFPRASQFYLVDAASTVEMLQAETELLLQLDKTPFHQGNALALARYYPSLEQQRQNHNLLRTIYYDSGRLNDWYTTLGLDTESIKMNARAFTADESISLSQWVVDAPPHIQSLWLGCDPLGCRSIVTLEKVLDKDQLATIAAGIDAVTWVDQVNIISTVLKRYRVLASESLAAVYTLIAGVLVFLFGWRSALRIVAVPSVSVALALSLTALVGNPFSLFNLLALMVVVGIGIDYAVFYHLHGRAQPSTALAVTLSALTTVLAFGMLSFSTTPVVHTFGVTLFVGISTAFLLAPFAAAPVEGTGLHLEKENDI